MTQVTILSPLPGVFYRRSSPEEVNYKEVGDNVALGDVIGLVEVMKTFTQVVSDVAGTISAFPAENEELVMPGQVLVEVDSE